MDKQKLDQLIRLAKEALRQGDRRTAGQLSRLVLDQHPNCLEAWLFLGGISKPEKRDYYLKQAQKIAPTDARVQKALIWADKQQTSDQQQSQLTQFSPGINNTQPISTTITEPHIEENHRLVWVWAIIFLLVISIVFLGMGALRWTPKTRPRAKVEF
jgi:hypothetical protein